MNTAARVAAAKRKYPEDFCPVKGCLWRVYTARGVNPCRNHPSEANDATPCGEGRSDAVGEQSEEARPVAVRSLPDSRPHDPQCKCHKCVFPF